MRGINRYNIRTVIEDLPENQTKLSDGSWTVARPLGFTGLWWRLKCAWIIFTGKADLLEFEEQ